MVFLNPPDKVLGYESQVGFFTSYPIVLPIEILSQDGGLFAKFSPMSWSGMGIAHKSSWGQLHQ